MAGETRLDQLADAVVVGRVEGDDALGEGAERLRCLLLRSVVRVGRRRVVRANLGGEPLVEQAGDDVVVAGDAPALVADERAPAAGRLVRFPVGVADADPDPDHPALVAQPGVDLVGVGDELGVEAVDPRQVEVLPTLRRLAGGGAGGLGGHLGSLLSVMPTNVAARGSVCEGNNIHGKRIWQRGSDSGCRRGRAADGDRPVVRARLGRDRRWASPRPAERGGPSRCKPRAAGRGRAGRIVRRAADGPGSVAPAACRRLRGEGVEEAAEFGLPLEADAGGLRQGDPAVLDRHVVGEAAERLEDAGV